MARKGGVRALCAAALAVVLAAAVAPAAGRALPAAAGPFRGAALASATAAHADAAAHRKLLLFGLTARDKAAHEEKRDALIEASALGARRARPATAAQRAARSLGARGA